MSDYFAQRLKTARIINGLSMEDLSMRMNPAVSKQSISKYEQGKMMPSDSVLKALSEALDFPLDYFFRETPHIERLNFRSSGSLSAHSEALMASLAQDRLERYLALEELLAICTTFTNPLKDWSPIRNFDEVEEAAVALRQQWSLGRHPLQSVYEMLESEGVKLIEFDAKDTRIDGFSTLANGNIPLIVVNESANATVERKRFTALHELAHLLLPLSGEFTPEQQERFCHRFAGAFLCPRPVFFEELGHHRTAFTLGELISIRQRYGISIAATVHRAKDLGIITDAYYNHIYNHHIHANPMEEGWGNFPLAEQTHRFERLLQRAVAEKIITLSHAAELANESESDYQQKIFRM